MEEQMRQVTECFEAIDINPSKENHLKLISILSSHKQLMKDEVRQARISMEQKYHLNDDEWNSWIEDELEEPIETRVFTYRLRLQDNPSSSLIWLNYLDLITIDNNAVYEATLNEALEATSYDILDNHLIIKRAIEYHEKIHPDAIKSLILSILKIPHSLINDTLSYYSSYVSKTHPDQYEQEMIEARNIASATMKFLDFVETREIESITNGHNSQFWINYLNQKGSKYFKSFPVLLGIFERAVRDQEIQEFIPVWQTILALAYELKASPIKINDLLTRFVKRYPDDCRSWTLYIRNLMVDEKSKFEFANESINKRQILYRNATPDGETNSLLMSIISFLFKLHLFDQYASYLRKYFDLSLKQNDSFCSVAKLIIQCYEFFESATIVKDLLKKLTSNQFHSSHVDVWLFRFPYELKYGDSKSVFKFIKECIVLAQHLDQPMRLFDEIQRYSYLHYDAVTDANIRNLIQKTAETMKQQQQQQIFSTTKRSHPDNELGIEEIHEDETSKKSRTADIKPRDREHLTLLVRNLPKNIKESQIRVFFKGCDPINNINIIHRENATSTEASVEFGTTQAMLSLLTKNYKRIGEQEISIEQAFNTTLWVTNFPPNVDKSWLETLFGNYGNVASVRLPSLKTNATRRFCYIEFTSSEDAATAVSLLNGKDLEGYELVVKVSNPDAKQKRAGAIEEGREVYICKIDFNKTTSDKVRQVFEKYGKVEKIYLPLSQKNKDNGRIHDGYGFVSFENLEDASKSLELNGVNLDGRIIEVSLAQPRSKTRVIIKNHSESSNTVDTIKSKTLKVSNLPDTINANRLKSILEQIGPVIKVDLNTESNSAIVEYENVADAGLASMKLSGMEIDGNVIGIDSRWGHEKKKQSIDPPPMNRRQRRLLLQQQQQQQQQLKLKESKDATTSDIEMTETKKGGLSNTDFRAMLNKN